MNYEAARTEVNKMTDPEVRNQAYSRIEAERYLEIALRHLVMANTGSFPTKEVTNRLICSIETLAAELK